VGVLSLRSSLHTRDLRSFPTRRSSDLRSVLRDLNSIYFRPRNINAASLLSRENKQPLIPVANILRIVKLEGFPSGQLNNTTMRRSEEHTSELQSRENLVCRLLLAKKES